MTSRLTLPHINMKTRKKVDFGAKRESPSPHITSVQYCGGCSVHRGDNISTVGDNISTVGDNISTVGDNFSTVGDSFSTVEVVQYSEGISSVLWRDTFSTVGE